MPPQLIFAVQSFLGYVACLLCFNAYVWPRLKSMDSVAAQRAIAAIHSFRFFGLVVVLPGVVGPNLPSRLATVAGYWDLAAGVLAILALLVVRVRPLFWLFVASFNLVGIVDLILTYYSAVRVNLPALAGQLGAAYIIPVLYVPLLTITHGAAVYLMLRRRPKAVEALAGHALAS